MQNIMERGPAGGGARLRRDGIEGLKARVELAGPHAPRCGST